MFGTGVFEETEISGFLEKMRSTRKLKNMKNTSICVRGDLCI